MKSVIFSEILINLFFATILTLFGVTLGFYPVIKGHFQPLWQLLTQKPWIVPLVGLCMASLGIFIFRKVLSHLQKSHFEIVTGKIKTWVDENALEKILQEFWKEKFKDEDLACYAHIYDNKLHIAAELPSDQKSDEEMKKLRSDLSERLHQSVGYIDEFSLAITEKTETKEPDDAQKEEKF